MLILTVYENIKSMETKVATKFKNENNLTTLPEWRPFPYNGNEPDPLLAPLWSGRGAFTTPPAIGARTFMTGGFGAATVTGYFIEYGFLGVYLKVDVLPKWFKEQSPGKEIVGAFGNDLKLAVL